MQEGLERRGKNVPQPVYFYIQQQLDMLDEVLREEFNGKDKKTNT